MTSIKSILSPQRIDIGIAENQEKIAEKCFLELLDLKEYEIRWRVYSRIEPYANINIIISFDWEF